MAEAPGATIASVPPAAVDRREWLRLARRARFLSWASLVYMGGEGAVAIIAGIVAASPALIGFGIDSGIEGVASLAIVWRFTGSRLLSERAERRAQRLVATQLWRSGKASKPGVPRAAASRAPSRGQPIATSERGGGRKGGNRR
jgi:hypothetical protein